MRAPPVPAGTQRLTAWLAMICMGVSLGAAASDPPGPAAAHLQFESVLDGRCQILSDGGKLRILRNTHATRAIKYRLTRVFVDTAQGLSIGVAPAASEDIKLGCTRVDGRSQDWTVERAQFTDEEPNE